MTNQKVYKASDMVNPLLDLNYGYARGGSVGTLNGKTGQLSSVTDALDGNKNRVYESDALGRLITAKGGLATGVTGVTANWTQEYSYDRYGNKTSTSASGITKDSIAVPSDGLPSLSFNSTSNRINSSGWEYDLSGNLVRGQNSYGVWQRFEYDEAGRSVRTKDDSGNDIEVYTYGASRERLVNETSAGRTYYAGGGNPICEYFETGTTLVWTKSYVYAGSRLLATYENNNGSELVRFHHADRLGTKLISTPGTPTYEEQATLPFGTYLAADSDTTSNQLFTSYDRSDNTGLDYAVNRTFSSGQGRFTQVDPIGMGAASAAPQSLNLYAYTQNSPVDFVDMSGLNESAIFIYPTNCQVVGEARDGSVIYACEWNIHIMPIGGGEPSHPPEEFPGGARSQQQQKKRKCKETVSLPGEETDEGAMARLIFQEATNEAAFANTDNPAKNWGKELRSVEASVLNRVEFLNQPGLRQDQTRGFGNVGASLRDVIFSEGKNSNGKTDIKQQFAGFMPGGVIAQSIKTRVSNALNSDSDSAECNKLRVAVSMANYPLGPDGRQRVGVANVFSLRTAGSASPGGAFYPLPQIPGSGNTFYGVRQ